MPDMPNIGAMFGGGGGLPSPGGDKAKMDDFMINLMKKDPKMAQIFVSKGGAMPGQQAPDPSSATAPPPEQTPEQAQAATPDYGGQDVQDADGTQGMSDFNANLGRVPMVAKPQVQSPKFRDQKNAHDTETAQIGQLIDQLDQAQQNDMHSAHQQRAAQLWAKAGNAVAHGFAPDRVPSISGDKLVDLPSEGDQMKTKIDMQDRLKQDLFKRENPEEDRQNKKLIETQKLLAAMDRLDQQEKAKAESDKTKADAKESQFTRGQSGQDRRNQASNAARIGAAEIGAGGQAGSRIAEKGASEEYDQAEKSNRKTYDGMDFHARGSVSADQANKFDKVMDNYGLIGPALDRVQELMSKDPRGIAKWGTEARNQLISAITSAGEGTVKNNGDGVVTGRDMDHALSQLGSPQGFENFVAGNGGAGLREFKTMIQRQLKARAVGSGYDEGAGQSNKLEDVHKRAAAFGVSQSQGGKKPNVKAQDAIDAVESAGKGQHATLHGRDEDPGTPDIPAKKSKGKTLVYDPDKGLVEQ